MLILTIFLKYFPTILQVWYKPQVQIYRGGLQSGGPDPRDFQMDRQDEKLRHWGRHCLRYFYSNMEPVLCFWISRIWIRLYLFRSGSFHNQVKTKKKTLVSAVLWLLLYRMTLSFKNDVNVPLKIFYKNWKKHIFFVDILKATDKKSRIQSWIRIRNSVVRIRILKCHGSITLD